MDALKFSYFGQTDLGKSYIPLLKYPSKRGKFTQYLKTGVEDEHIYGEPCAYFPKKLCSWAFFSKFGANL